MIDSDPNKPLVHWASLPGRPEKISVHPAPMLEDMRDALREAQRKQPDWLILDTEGSIRGAMAFTTLRLDLVVTPLAASQLEAIQAIKAAEMLEADYGITADIWSATSLNELARDGQDAARWNRLNPLEAPRVPYVTQALSGAKGPFIAATDYMKNYAEQIRAFVPGRYTVLGTDGFGRSDSRVNLRRFFEVDANHIAAAAMVDLFREGAIDEATLRDALSRYDIDGGKPNPRLV